MIARFLTYLLEKWEDRDSNRMFGARRDPGWRRLRQEHIKENPECVVTGSTKRVQVHHILPVWLYPLEEMNPDNLITLRKDVHLLIGHLGSYRSYNPNIREDAQKLKLKIWNRLP